MDFGNNEEEWFNCNGALPWSIELIEKFRNKWNWELLSQNHAVITNVVVREHIIKELFPYIEEKILAGFPDKKVDFFEEEVNSNLSIINKYIEYQFNTETEIEQCKVIDWNALSHNTFLPWSAELIRKYIDKWNWVNLSKNRSLPWSFELVKEFENSWCWGGDFVGKDGSIFCEDGLSSNYALPWNSNFIKHFQHRFESQELSYNEGIEWNIDMLIEFKDLVSFSSICFNSKVWNNVFPEFHQLEKGFEVLDLLLLRQKEKQRT